jgi:hypothetical protein
VLNKSNYIKMPEDETIIPEVVNDDAQVSNISFTPVSNDENEVILEVAPVVTAPVVEVKQDDVVIPNADVVVDPPADEEEEDDYTELDEDLAMEYLADSKGMTVEELKNSLTPKEQKKYAPEMEKFNEFIEKTGNKNYNDFLETQKDWSVESPENVLKTYIKLSNPDLSEKEANHLYNKKYNIEGLDEEDDEDEILERGINVKADLRKANEFFEQRKQEFSAVGGSDDYIPEAYREAKKFYDDHTNQEEEFSKDLEQKRNSFVSKTEALFNRDFEGFKIKLGDDAIGFEEFSIKPENLNEVKEEQLDSRNFIKPFLDEETGEVKDHKGYHEAIYMAKNYKTELNNAYKRGMAKQLEINDKLSKNIQPDNIRTVPTGVTSVTFIPDN